MYQHFLDREMAKFLIFRYILQLFRIKSALLMSKFELDGTHTLCFPDMMLAHQPPAVLRPQNISEILAEMAYQCSSAISG